MEEDKIAQGYVACMAEVLKTIEVFEEYADDYSPETMEVE